MTWSADLSLFDEAVCDAVVVAVVDFNAEDVDTVTLLVVAVLSILLVILSLDLTLDFEVLEVAFVLFIAPTLLDDTLPVLLDFFTRLKSPFDELLDVGSGSEIVESVLRVI